MSERDSRERDEPLYDADFLTWTQEQARALEERRWDDLDLANLADEVRSLGVELVRQAEQRTEILVSYLLKWLHLAEYRGRAWKENIDRQRQEIADMTDRNASLSDLRQHLVARSYENGRRRLKYETYFYETDFPASCPFTVEQVFDPTYFPEELDAPAIGAFPTARLIA